MVESLATMSMFGWLTNARFGEKIVWVSISDKNPSPNYKCLLM